MYTITPFDRRRSLFNVFDDEFWGAAVSSIRTDILRQEDKYVVKVELPGFSKEDISIDVEEGQLIISATRQESSEDTQGNYVRRESRTGSFRRVIDLTGIDTSCISAAYKDGILTVELPKEAPAESLTQRIMIN